MIEPLIYPDSLMNIEKETQIRDEMLVALSHRLLAPATSQRWNSITELPHEEYPQRNGIQILIYGLYQHCS